MKNSYLLNLFLVLVIALSSCSPYQNSMYFQGLDRNSSISHKIDNATPLTIQTGDVLSINVKSLNPEGSAIFNADNSAATSSGSAGSSGGSTPSGYIVDQKGNVNLPLIHGVKVVGMTLPEAQSTIQAAITPFLKEPIVTVHIVNFKITIIGDVAAPGTIGVTGDHISIPQALSQVGDLTPSARRDNILLVREINGERKYVNIDITSNKLFDSPYYYLKNNDILYVEAGRGKFLNVNPTKQNLSIFLSLLSLILVGFEVSRRH